MMYKLCLNKGFNLFFFFKDTLKKTIGLCLFLKLIALR